MSWMIIVAIITLLFVDKWLPGGFYGQPYHYAVWVGKHKSSYHPVACRVPCWDIFGNQGLNILRIKFITNCTVKHPYLVPLTSIPSWVHSALQHKNNSLETLSFGKTVLISWLKYSCFGLVWFTVDSYKDFETYCNFSEMRVMNI